MVVAKKNMAFGPVVVAPGGDEDIVSSTTTVLVFSEDDDNDDLSLLSTISKDSSFTSSLVVELLIDAKTGSGRSD
jgi:hypothetical protein